MINQNELYTWLYKYMLFYIRLNNELMKLKEQVLALKCKVLHGITKGMSAQQVCPRPKLHSKYPQDPQRVLTFPKTLCAQQVSSRLQVQSKFPQERSKFSNNPQRAVKFLQVPKCTTYWIPKLRSKFPLDPKNATSFPTNLSAQQVSPKTTVRTKLLQKQNKFPQDPKCASW